MSDIAGTSFIKKCNNHVEAVIDDELVLMHIEQGRFFSLSGTSRSAWELIGEGISFDELVAGLLKKYQVSKEICAAEIFLLLDKLRERTLIEVDFQPKSLT